MSRYLFDLETDNLLDDVKHIWVNCVINLDTNEELSFLEDDLSWMDLFSNATKLVGHNIIGFDLPVLKKLHKWIPNKSTVIHDTLLMSKAQDYHRFGHDGHALEAWGILFNELKDPFNDFSQYSPELHERCRKDVRLNLRVYNFLLREFAVIIKRNPSFKLALQNEHIAAKACAGAHEHGWLFDREGGIALLAKMEAEMHATEEIIVPKLLLRTKATDTAKGEYPFKEPKWIKNGNYNAHTANWFGVCPTTGQDEDRLIEGPYSRIEFIKPDMSNMGDIKTYLFSIGWEPDDWNTKKTEAGGYERTSPKLSEASLLALGEDGRLINDYTTTKSRYGILHGWLEALTEDNRLHGSCNTYGTPTGRATHKIIANVPKYESIWGKEIRSLFICPPGKKIVGADSSSNQFRALCHYLKNDEFTEVIISGDVHQVNADLLTSILQEMSVLDEGEVIARGTAKPFIYAFLFGGGGEKLCLIVLKRRDRTIGNKLKSEFISRVPGLKPLVKQIDDIFYKTAYRGQGYIPGIDGTRIYCDSKHKLLNYLLQRFEAISCKAALAYAVTKLDDLKIPYTLLTWYHDEFQLEVNEEDAQKVLEIGIEAYRESGKPFGITILDGAGKIGNSWADTH